MEKDSEIVKGKKEKMKSIALKARVESSDEESCSSSEDEEYAMAVRDFKKFFRRRGKFVRPPCEEKKSLRKDRDDRKGKLERKCYRCGDSSHLIENVQSPQRTSLKEHLLVELRVIVKVMTTSLRMTKLLSWLKTQKRYILTRHILL